MTVNAASEMHSMHCILCLTQHLTDQGILPGSAAQCMLRNMYLRSSYQGSGHFYAATDLNKIEQKIYRDCQCTNTDQFIETQSMSCPADTGSGDIWLSLGLCTCCFMFVAGRNISQQFLCTLQVLPCKSQTTSRKTITHNALQFQA